MSVISVYLLCLLYLYICYTCISVMSVISVYLLYLYIYYICISAISVYLLHLYICYIYYICISVISLMSVISVYMLYLYICISVVPVISVYLLCLLYLLYLFPADWLHTFMYSYVSWFDVILCGRGMFALWRDTLAASVLSKGPLFFRIWSLARYKFMNLNKASHYELKCPGITPR